MTLELSIPLNQIFYSTLLITAIYCLMNDSWKEKLPNWLQWILFPGLLGFVTFASLLLSGIVDKDYLLIIFSFVYVGLIIKFSIED